MEQRQTKLFDKYNVFFAFSNEQFDKQKISGITYISLGIGMYAPKTTYKNFLKEHKALVKTHIKEDIAENGKHHIIERELANHECYYIDEIEDCIDALKGYDITEEEIWVVYHVTKRRYF